MRAFLTDELARFDAAALAFLDLDPVGNTIALSVLAGLRAGGGYGEGAWFAWAEDGGVTVGAAFRTPPHLVGLAVMPEPAAAAIGTACAALDLPGAVGAQPTVEAFARGAGRASSVGVLEVQRVLHSLHVPPDPGGAARPYEDSDEARYVEWMHAFHAEAGLAVSGDPLVALANRRAGGGELWLWCVDEEPVCLAGIGPDRRVPRVGPVYTPPEHRRRGYAAALTAHLSARALASGAEAVTLFADAANATSNGIYERLGFATVGTFVEAALTPLC